MTITDTRICHYRQHTHFFQGHHGFGILEKPFGIKNSDDDYDELLLLGFLLLSISFVNWPIFQRLLRVRRGLVHIGLPKKDPLGIADARYFTGRMPLAQK